MPRAPSPASSLVRVFDIPPETLLDPSAEWEAQGYEHHRTLVKVCQGVLELWCQKHQAGRKAMLRSSSVKCSALVPLLVGSAVWRSLGKADGHEGLGWLDRACDGSTLW